MSIYHKVKGSIVLKIVIALLIGLLIYVIYEPYQIMEEEEANKAESRSRLVNIRSAQLQYIGLFGVYASSIDTLVQFVKDYFPTGTDTTEIFKPFANGPFVAESLLYTPKSHRKYIVTSVDTTIIKKYLLEDPDGYGSIGSLTDDARVNKASWED